MATYVLPPLPSHYLLHDAPSQALDKPVIWAIYVRISKDVDLTGDGVERQETIVREMLAARSGPEGPVVYGIFVDNDITASKRTVRRPDYDRMVGLIEAGLVTGIAVYNSDRLTRQPSQNEDVIRWAEERGLQLASARGFIDLSTPDGQRQFRTNGAQAAYESAITSRRLKDKFDQKAQRGEAHGPVPYGWIREVVRNEKGRISGTEDVLDPAAAEAIRWAAKALLDGRTLRGVAAEMNERGWVTGGGRRWTSSLLRQVMLRERNAGLRVHRGRIVGMGAFAPIYDTDTYDRLAALLTDPARQTNKGKTRRHLLSRIMICGVCGSNQTCVKLRGVDGSANSYICACGGVKRKQAPVDKVVRRAMIKILLNPNAMDALVTGDPKAVEQAKESRAAALARKEIASKRFSAGLWDADRVDIVDAQANPVIAEAERIIRAAIPPTLPADMCGPDAEARWDAADLETKRNLIQAFLSITLLPTAQRGAGAFDPASVQIVPNAAILAAEA